jgi:hypothetical protein
MIGDDDGGIGNDRDEDERQQDSKRAHDTPFLYLERHAGDVATATFSSTEL